MGKKTKLAHAQIPYYTIIFHFIDNKKITIEIVQYLKKKI